MGFFSGLSGGSFGGFDNPFGPPPVDVLPAEPGAYAGYASAGKKGGGGLFGSGISGDQISQALGALAGGQQQAPEPYHFQPLQLPHGDYSGLNSGGSFQRPVPPMNLANYFQMLGMGGGY